MAKSQKAKAQEAKAQEAKAQEAKAKKAEEPILDEEVDETEETEEAEEEVETEASEEETEVTEEETPKAKKYEVAKNERHLFHVILDKPHYNSKTGKKLTKAYPAKFKPKAFKQFKEKAKELGYEYKVIHKPK